MLLVRVFSRVLYTCPPNNFILVQGSAWVLVGAALQSSAQNIAWSVHKSSSRVLSDVISV